MEFNFSSRPNRRFLIRLAGSAIVLGLSIVTARYLIGQGLVGGSLVWALALIPGLAMVGIFYAYGMLIIEQRGRVHKDADSPPADLSLRALRCRSQRFGVSSRSSGSWNISMRTMSRSPGSSDSPSVVS